MVLGPDSITQAERPRKIRPMTANPSLEQTRQDQEHSSEQTDEPSARRDARMVRGGPGHVWRRLGTRSFHHHELTRRAAPGEVPSAEVSPPLLDSAQPVRRLL